MTRRSKLLINSQFYSWCEAVRKSIFHIILYSCVCFIQGRGRLGAIYTFAAGNGGIFSDSCAYNGYVNSIYTIAINGLNEDGSNPTYAEDCPGIMATAYSRDTLKGLGKVVSKNKQFCFNDFSVLSLFSPCRFLLTED